jgi:hypothetical protein
VKSPGSIGEVHWILPDWSAGGENGIPGVEVKFVDIRRNNCGEGGSLDCN